MTWLLLTPAPHASFLTSHPHVSVLFPHPFMSLLSTFTYRFLGHPNALPLVILGSANGVAYLNTRRRRVGRQQWEMHGQRQWALLDRVTKHPVEARVPHWKIPSASCQSAGSWGKETCPKMEIYLACSNVSMSLSMWFGSDIITSRLSIMLWYLGQNCSRSQIYQIVFFFVLIWLCHSNTLEVMTALMLVLSLLHPKATVTIPCLFLPNSFQSFIIEVSL